MESYSGISGEEEEEEHMELPPGFRFHPTDEELITHYLAKKVINNNFTSKAMGEADFNKIEPWDLPSKAKMGEKEWYFFCVRDRKYPNGERTNRATKAGYWKATGKDKEIYRAKKLVGMKKTLVFYKGRAPKGQKTNWVMHEYRLEGMYIKVNLPKTAQNEWVISRVFKKVPSMNHQSIPGFASQEELQQPFLPPLTDSSPYGINDIKSTNSANQSYVTRFSNHPLVTENKSSAITTTTTTTTSTFLIPSKFPPQKTLMEQTKADFQFADSLLMQEEPPILKFLLEGNKDIPKEDMPQDTGLSVSDFGQNPPGLIDLDCLWDY